MYENVFELIHRKRNANKTKLRYHLSSSDWRKFKILTMPIVVSMKSQARPYAAERTTKPTASMEGSLSTNLLKETIYHFPVDSYLFRCSALPDWPAGTHSRPGSSSKNLH